MNCIVAKIRNSFCSLAVVRVVMNAQFAFPHPSCDGDVLFAGTVVESSTGSEKSDVAGGVSDLSFDSIFRPPTSSAPLVGETLVTEGSPAATPVLKSDVIASSVKPPHTVASTPATAGKTPITSPAAPVSAPKNTSALTAVPKKVTPGSGGVQASRSTPQVEANNGALKAATAEIAKMKLAVAQMQHMHAVEKKMWELVASEATQRCSVTNEESAEFSSLGCGIISGERGLHRMAELRLRAEHDDEMGVVHDRMQAVHATLNARRKQDVPSIVDVKSMIDGAVLTLGNRSVCFAAPDEQVLIRD